MTFDQFPSNEGLRILLAIKNRTMGSNSSGRYIIVGQDRPDRKTREQLSKRGLIEHWWDIKNGYEWRLTDKGRDALSVVGL